MTSDNLNISDRTEIIRLARIAAIRGAQIIIQSRNGRKALTKCNPTASGHATFNLSLQEGDMDKDVKRAMSSVNERWSLCIEVFLKTHEDDVMTLETWNISLIAGYAHNARVCKHTLAQRFTVLLKALLAVTRAIPAYRYSRQQNTDSWTVDYRVYHGEPICNSLGNQFKTNIIGAISMPVGLFQVSVFYRTKMTISQQPSGIETSLILKSDHFRPDFSPKHINRYQSSDDDNKSSVSDEGPKIGAFVNSRRESLARSETDQLIPLVPFGSLLNAKILLQQSATATNAVSGNELCDRLKAIKLDKDDANGNAPVTKSVSSCNNDDFIVVDIVKPPFAETSGTIELGTFYQEWKTAPPLQTCPTDPKVIDQLGDLTSQLAYFETNLKEFDNVVTSLCHEGTDNNENTSQLET